MRSHGAVRDWAISNGYSDLENVGAGIGVNYPVHSVNWYDVVKWTNARSQKEGLTPVYEFSGTVYKTGESGPTVNSIANGYRLPTEAEWERAARGGASSQGFIYSGSNDANAVACYRDRDGASAVGTKAANELGIHDMSGNVWEWCWDTFFYSHPYTIHRIRGGGWWDDYAEYGAVANRDNYFGSWYRFDFIGFRLARNAP